MTCLSLNLLSAQFTGSSPTPKKKEIFPNRCNPLRERERALVFHLFATSILIWVKCISIEIRIELFSLNINVGMKNKKHTKNLWCWRKACWGTQSIGKTEAQMGHYLPQSPKVRLYLSKRGQWKRSGGLTEVVWTSTLSMFLDFTCNWRKRY